MPLPGRPDLLRAGSHGRSTVARAIAIFVALIVLLVSLSAEAKKKKGGKKHKTPAAKTKGKSTQAAPDSSADSDDDDDEKPSSSKPAAEEEESKPPAPPPPSEEEEAPVRKPAKAKAPQPEKDEAEGGDGLFALRLGVGGGALFRNLVWTGSNGALSPYSLSPGPQLALWFEAFPAAFATSGFAANIGLWGRFNYGFGASSRLMNGTVLTTKYQDFLFGLKVRIPVGSFQPNVAVAYGNQAFQLTPTDPSRPNFNYGFVHLGGGARILFTPSIDLDLSIAYLHVLSPGARNTEVAQLYPDASAYGVDIGGSLGFRLVSMIGLRVGGNFRQFGVNTGFMTGDTGVPAAGAADRSITIFGGLEVWFDGVGGGAAEEEAPAKKKPAKAKKPPPREDDGEGGGEAPEVKTDKTDKADE